MRNAKELQRPIYAKNDAGPQLRILKELGQEESVSADYKEFTNRDFGASTELHILKDLASESRPSGHKKSGSCLPRALIYPEKTVN